MGVILPGVERDFPPVFSWDWDGKRLKLLACDDVNALPHAYWIIVVEMFFNFVFICSFGCFDGSPEIVTGLFPIVSVSGFKGRCPR